MISNFILFMQNNHNGDVDSLKNMLADKDAEIHNLLERIEEMQDIFTLTSKRVGYFSYALS